MPEKDPWEEAAKQFKPAGGATAAAPANDDWKVWQQNDKPKTEDQGVLTGIYNNTLKPFVDMYHGAQAKADASEREEQGMSLPDKLAHRFKESVGPAISASMPAIQIAQSQVPMFQKAAGALTAPNKTMGQRAAGAIGYGLAGLMPGTGPMMAQAGETGATRPNEGLGEGIGGLITTFLPEMAGAAAGKLAPGLAETAMGIGAKQRGFGRTSGKAILNETRGIQPETIAESGRERIGMLTPELERIVQNAPGMADLTPARKIIDQHMQQAAKQNATSIHSQLEPMMDHLTKDQFAPTPAAPTPVKPNLSPTHMALADQTLQNFGTGAQGITRDLNPRFNSRNGTTVNLVARDARGTPIGYLKYAADPQTGTILQTRPLEVYVDPSFRRAGVASDLFSEAQSLGHDVLGAAQTTNKTPLGASFVNGVNAKAHSSIAPPQIPQMVSPSQLLDLKRGFGQEHAQWNPDIHKAVNSTGKRAYGALDKELDRTVPEAAPLNQRISSLIPAVQRAEAVARMADMPQRVMQRFGARTGALASMIGGAHFGGLPGAVAGLVLPELMADPAAQMIAARTMHGISKIPGKGIAAASLVKKAKNDNDETSQ